jgi:ketosteroid isomerase-like protein
VLGDAQLVTRVYDAFNTGGVRAAADYIHPDAEFIDPVELPGADHYMGREAVIAYLDNFVEAWGVVNVVIEEFHGAGGRLGAQIRIDLKGAASGLETVMRVVHVIDIEDGQIRRVQAFFDREEGLGALVGKSA